MAKTRRAYEGAGASTTLNGAFAAAATTFSIAAATGWPYGADPFFIVIEPGTSNEEKILVTRTNSGDLTLTVSGSRGADGTTDVTHADGSTVYPVFTATDADEANELASTWTTKGDIVTHGASSFERLAVGSDGEVLTADSTASGGVAWGQVPASSIADGAVTTAKIAADAVTATKLADDAVVTANIVDGSVTNAKIGADAVDGTKIADDAIGSEHIATGAVGSSELASTAVSAGSYGDADSVGSFTVDADGRLTAASNTNISIASSAVSDATDANTASKIVKRDASGNFSAGTISAAFSGNLTGNVTGDVTGNVTGNADTASTWQTARSVSLTGDVTGSATGVDGSGNVSISTTGRDGMMRGNGGAATGVSLSPNGYGTINHGLSSTPVAAFVQPTSVSSSTSDTIVSIIVTSLSSTQIQFRAYEIDGLAYDSNSSANVSSITSTVDVMWVAWESDTFG